MKTLGLYIDFPFCIARCAFCAFSVEGYRERWAERYMQALHKEFEQYAEDPIIQRRTITSIYLGGGTPSHYPHPVIEDLLARCRRLFHVAADAEVTVEAHPSTLKPSDLSAFLEMGINRLSIGMQSFSDTQLLTLGRHHTAKEADAAFHAARSSGFKNIGIDLMYALPEQTMGDWEETLHHAIELSPEHISIYALSIEEGTLFAKKEKAGHLLLPSEETTAVFYTTARAQLSASHYRQYEISNFALPGYACRHNMRYWDQKEMLSFGVSAHAYFNHERRINTDSIPRYIEMMEAGSRPLVEVLKISPRESLVDQVIFGLRKTVGIPSHLLSNDPLLHQATENLKKKGLIKIKGRRVQLTSQGMLLADEVAMAYL